MYSMKKKTKKSTPVVGGNKQREILNNDSLTELVTFLNNPTTTHFTDSIKKIFYNSVAGKESQVTKFMKHAEHTNITFAQINDDRCLYKKERKSVRGKSIIDILHIPSTKDPEGVCSFMTHFIGIKVGNGIVLGSKLDKSDGNPIRVKTETDNKYELKEKVFKKKII